MRHGQIDTRQSLLCANYQVLTGVGEQFLDHLPAPVPDQVQNTADHLFTVTPILPGMKGRVIEVTAKANEPLKAGDELLAIDPRPYQYLVDRKNAALAEAMQNVKQLKAQFDQASAAAEKANAQLQLACCVCAVWENYFFLDGH